MTIYLPKGALISIDGLYLSEHNRSAAGFGFDLIQIQNRTLTGRMRKQQITQKKKIDISWDRLPALDGGTVDGNAGRNSIAALKDALWNNSFSSSVVTYREVDDDNAQYEISLNMFLDSYSEDLVKRWGQQLWNVKLTLVEA